MAEVGQAFVSLVPSARGFADATAKELNKAGPAISRAGTTSGEKFAKGFTPGLKAIQVGLGAIVGLGIGRFLNDTVRAASDLSETQSKVGVVFGKSAKSVLDFGESAAKGIGQSTQQAEEATATFGNLFVSMKLGQKTSADMSIKLVKLASDLASFNNVDPGTALEALRSGLVGETEPLRKFGVNLNDADLRQRALALGLVTSTKTVLPPAIRAQAAYSLILEQTKTAQGDFQRTSGGLANQQRILAAETENLKASLGKALLPAMTAVTKVTNSALSIFTALPAPVQTMAVAFAAVGTALALVLPRIVAFKAALATMPAGVTKAAGAVTRLAVALGLVASAGAAANAATSGGLGASAQSVDELSKSTHDLKFQFENAFGTGGTFTNVLNGIDAFGRGLVGATSLIDAGKESMKALDEQMAANVRSGNAEENGKLWNKLKDVAREQGLSITDLKKLFPAYSSALDGLTVHIKGQTTAYKDLTKAFNDNIERMDASKRSAIAAREAHRTAAATLKDLGKNAKASGADVDAAFLSVLDSADAAAAAVKDVGGKNAAYRGELVRLRDTLKKGSPLRKALDDYISKLGAIPANKTTNININLSVEGLAKVIAAGQSLANIARQTKDRRTFDEGGWVPGPKGAPQLAIVHGGEFVLSADMLAGKAASPATGGGSAGNTYNIYSLNPDDIAAAVDRRDRRRAVLAGG